MCAFIVTGVDTPLVLEPAERIFDLAPFSIENAMMFGGLRKLDFDGMQALGPRTLGGKTIPVGWN